MSNLLMRKKKELDDLFLYLDVKCKERERKRGTLTIPFILLLYPPK